MIDALPLSAPTSPHALETALRRRIGWICHLVRIAALIWFLWMFGIFVYFVFHRADYFDRSLTFLGLDPSVVPNLNYWLGESAALIVYFATALAVWRLWQLMQGYLGGDIFTIRAADRLRLLAITGLVAAALDVITRPLGFMLMSPQILTKIPFWQFLAPVDLFYALVCGFFLALAAIFKTAAEIAEENAQIV